MSDAFVTQLQAMIEQQVSEVNTSIPGTVVAYDAGTNRATVRAAIPKRIADGSQLDPPTIYSVPVQWPRAGGTSITMPVQPGDGVMLHFSQRSLEGWLSGDSAAPDDPRQYDISDAVAVPGLAANLGGPVDPVNMVISFGSVSIKLTPGGKVIITAPGGIDLISTGVVAVQSPTMTQTGTITATGAVSGAGKSLSTHVHTGVVAGPGNSGPPL